jgi:RimJ/RimL family protein N-acetyltransferase
MLADHYAAYGLRLRTPRLELRLPDLEDLARLADVAIDGVHDPAVMPFGVAWTDQEPAALGRAVVTYQMGIVARSTPARWSLPFGVFTDGAIIGIQELTGADFALLREVGTGSWIGRRYHGQGVGTEMRAAVLHLAFAGLGAHYATSEAFTDNAASNGVSRRLGYRLDGIRRHVVRGHAATMNRLRLDRDGWAAHRTVPVTIEGLTAACRAELGATDLDVAELDVAERDVADADGHGS